MKIRSACGQTQQQCGTTTTGDMHAVSVQCTHTSGDFVFRRVVPVYGGLGVHTAGPLGRVVQRTESKPLR